jgi:hypothetical protein
VHLATQVMREGTLAHGTGGFELVTLDMVPWGMVTTCSHGTGAFDLLIIAPSIETSQSRTRDT